MKSNINENSRRNTYGNNEELKSEFQLQVGYEKENEEKAEPDFVRVPMPLFLDTMKLNVPSGTGEFQELLCLGNDLLEQLLDLGKAKLAPGESMEIPLLKVRLYRKRTSQADNHKKVRVDLGV